jgi:hypothetical protein
MRPITRRTLLPRCNGHACDKQSLIELQGRKEAVLQCPINDNYNFGKCLGDYSELPFDLYTQYIAAFDANSCIERDFKLWNSQEDKDRSQVVRDVLNPESDDVHLQCFKAAQDFDELASFNTNNFTICRTLGPYC